MWRTNRVCWNKWQNGVSLFSSALLSVRPCRASFWVHKYQNHPNTKQEPDSSRICNFKGSVGIPCITQKGSCGKGPVPLLFQTQCCIYSPKLSVKMKRDFMLGLASYCYSTVMSFAATQQLFSMSCKLNRETRRSKTHEREKWRSIIVLTADKNFIYPSNDHRVPSFWCVS